MSETRAEALALRSYSALARRLSFKLMWDDEGAGQVRTFTVRLEPSTARARAAMSKVDHRGLVMAIESSTTYRDMPDRVDALEKSCREACGIAASLMS